MEEEFERETGRFKISSDDTDKNNHNFYYERNTDELLPISLNKASSERKSNEPPLKKTNINFMKSDEWIQVIDKKYQDNKQSTNARKTFGRQLRFDGEVVKYDESMRNIQINENVKWLISPTKTDLKDLTQDVLDFWLRKGESKKTIDDETKFCDPLILQQILKVKTMFDQVNRNEIQSARSKCNPFEAIRQSIFQNRAAVKIANLDAILNFMFTEPRDENGELLVKDLLYFADICAGPGGFSEYILWRKKWSAKGFGFTLRNEFDFNLHAFGAGNTETFDAFYGVKDDGNILDPENIRSLQTFVLNQTNETGVHLLMADGGFYVDEKNIQEILCKQLYLCQFLAVLSLVREGGSFVVKMFDVFTLFTAGLLFLMYKCFKQICIIKPNASRPGNSERYIIGKFKRPNTDTIQNHLFNINQEMWNNQDTKVDVLELIPFEIIKEDRNFFNYLCESNNSIGRNQVVNLLKVAAFINNKKLTEPRQEEIHQICLKTWMLPTSQQKYKQSVYGTFEQLMGNWFDQKHFMLSPDQLLSNESDLSNVFHYRSNCFFIPIDTAEGSEKCIRTFFMSRGGYNVCCLSTNGMWKPLQNVAIEFSADTLLYGEIVTELCEKSKSQTSVPSLHIIDGMVLGGVNIRHLPLKERLKVCERFANAHNKPNRFINFGGNVTSTVWCKKLYPLNELRQFFDHLGPCTLKDGRKRLALKIRNCMGLDRWYVPRGLLFFNDLKPNIEIFFSKTYQKEYFVDISTGNTFFQDQIQDPAAIYSSFKTTFVNRHLWEWKSECQVYEKNTQDKIDGLLYRYDLDRYIYSSEHTPQSNVTSYYVPI